MYPHFYKAANCTGAKSKPHACPQVDPFVWELCRTIHGQTSTYILTHNSAHFLITFLLQTQVLQSLPTYNALAMNWLGLLFQMHCGQASEVDRELFQDHERNIISMIGYQSYTCFRDQYVTLLHTKFTGEVARWKKGCTKDVVDDTFDASMDTGGES